MGYVLESEEEREIGEKLEKGRREKLEKGRNEYLATTK